VIEREAYERPDFFDFDLFTKRKTDSKLNDMRLKDIVYTVFDTETTGLDTRNDEIISIGGVRIVNGRILCGEKFNQLIDPKINIPLESEKFHGINDEMVKGKPDIKEVLPLFYKFSKDTVLVAHNAAFDMKMFSMKEAQTGIKFDNPLLDTLLLALIVYPMHEKHNMAAIASFAGVDIVGRHTAIGDASATAGIFLKLIPLLAKKGIHTLNDAINASKKTLYSKLKY
jgi:DNA polymerase-3 subunit epsilon